MVKNQRRPVQYAVGVLFIILGLALVTTRELRAQILGVGAATNAGNRGIQGVSRRMGAAVCLSFFAMIFERT